MGESQRMKMLLKRFTDNTINKAEFDELFRLMEESGSEDSIKDLMREHWENINSDSGSDTKYSLVNNELLRDTLEKIDQKKAGQRKASPRLYAMAAVLLLFFGLGYFYYTGSIDPIVEESLTIEEEKVVLKLNNGETRVISGEENGKIVNTKGLVVGTLASSSIVYKNNISEEKLEYNTLMVPYGKRFQVVLSDGTLVHLNAGTILKYPVKFIKGFSREVYLEGEAYFDVARDTDHPFLVNSNDLDIKVLGTRFNITAYPENELIKTVLVEGSVEVSENTAPSAVLEPGHMAAWNKSAKDMTVSQVDVEPYLAWREGRLILNEVDFGIILKKLERQYNVQIVNNNSALSGRYFTARFDIEDIYQVMKSLSVSASFDYTLNGNLIIIN